jgi:hypothetical protein
MTNLPDSQESQPLDYGPPPGPVDSTGCLILSGIFAGILLLCSLVTLWGMFASNSYGMGMILAGGLVMTTLGVVLTKRYGKSVALALVVASICVALLLFGLCAAALGT